MFFCVPNNNVLLTIEIKKKDIKKTHFQFIEFYLQRTTIFSTSIYISIMYFMVCQKKKTKKPSKLTVQ